MNPDQITCFYHEGEFSFTGYGCFVGTEQEITDMIVFLLNEDENFMQVDQAENSKFCQESENDEMEKIEFKNRLCNKIIDQLVEPDDINFLFGNSFGDGKFYLTPVPFYRV